MNTRKFLRVLVLIGGLAMAFGFTLAPLLFYGIDKNELITELVSGAGIGWIISSLPYIFFWFATKKRNLKSLYENIAIAILLLSGIAGLVMMIIYNDPQIGIAYVIYILPLQYLVVITAYLSSSEK